MMTSRQLRPVVQAGLLAALYVAAAKAGLLLATVGAQVTLAWPPTGLALTALLLGGVRLWPGVALGAALVNASTGVSLATAFGMGTGNTLEAVLAVVLLRRLGFQPSLDRLHDVWALIVLAAGLSTVASATIGVASLVLGGVLPWHMVATAWGTWWLGDALGDVVVAPALLVWAALPGRRLTRRRSMEAVVLLGATVAAGLGVFSGGFGATGNSLAVVYLVVPLLLWATLRFGPPGAALFTVVVSGLALWGTVHATGLLAHSALLREHLLNTQLFMGIIGVTGLILAAAVAERERAVTRVSALNSELEQRVAERTAQLVAANKERFSLVFSEVPTGMALAAPDGRLLEVNRALCQILGYTEQELLDLRYPVLTHPDDLPESRELIRRLLAGEIQTGALEKRYLHREGHVVWSKYTATLLRDTAGRPLYFIYHLQDITERKQAEEALRASESRLRTVLGHAPVILFALDIAGIVTLCEGQGLTALELASGAAVGQPVAALYRDDPDVLAHIRRALAGTDSAVVSQVDGIVLDTRLVPLRDEHGGVRGVIGVAIDVTERVRAEAAERAVQARDEFLSVAAHELKTPLTSLGGFAQLLLDYLTTGRVMAPERSQRVLRQIASQTDKVNQLVDHLLDVTRLEAGRLTLERRETDLAHLAHEVATAAQAQTGAHSLIVMAPSAVPAWVDPLRLEQVLTNLVYNAIKYSPDGGPITITLAGTQGRECSGPRTVHLAVQDRGLGIPAEHRTHIFDRFYQAHANSYRSGLGLGLYISHQIVALHGGQLTAEFPPEGGSRFVVSLPLGEDNGDPAVRTEIEEEVRGHIETGVSGR